MVVRRHRPHDDQRPVSQMRDEHELTGVVDPWVLEAHRPHGGVDERDRVPGNHVAGRHHLVRHRVRSVEQPEEILVYERQLPEVVDRRPQGGAEGASGIGDVEG
jgi:hypothetical protein